MESVQRVANSGTEPGFPFFLMTGCGDAVVRGKAKWISRDVVYVLVPYGTATASREEWEAMLIAGGEGKAEPPGERHVSVQLIAADHCVGADEEMEGLLLRLLDTEDRRHAQRRAMPSLLLNA